MIKHFVIAGLIALLIALAIASYLVPSAKQTLTWALGVVYVASVVAVVQIVERRRGARPGALSIISFLVAAVVYPWSLLGGARWWVKALLLGVAIHPIRFIANATFRADVLRAQKRRDARATRLAQAVRAGEATERFALYLRPFVTTDRLMVSVLPSNVSGEVPLYLDVETLLARSFRGEVPVIALGKSGDTVEGVARVTVSDDDWRETVEALARHAEFIVMVPFSRPGTMWELEWLTHSDLLNKVLFIMPETPHTIPSGVDSPQETDDRIFQEGVRQFEASIHMLNLQKEWLDVERVAGTLALEFPPLAAVGALYTMSPTTGAVKDIVPLSLSMLSDGIGYIHTSVMRLALLPPSKTPVDFLQDFVEAVGNQGRTLEYTLMRAADGYTAWGNAVTATRLTRRAVKAGQPHPEIAAEYINALPALIEGLLEKKDVRAAKRYADFARQARADSLLSSLAMNETLRRLDSLFEDLEVSGPNL